MSESASPRVIGLLDERHIEGWSHATLHRFDVSTGTGRLIFSAAALLFCLVLTWSYAHVESVVYQYAGLRFSAPPPLIAISAVVLAILPTVWLPLRAERASGVAIVIFYLLVYAPFCVVAPYMLPWPAASLLALEVFLLANFAVLCWIPSFPRGRFVHLAVRQRPFLTLLCVATVTLAFLGAAVNGFQMNLGVTDVYTRRLEARETVRAGSALGYALALLTTALIPVTLATGIARQRAWLVVSALVGVLAMFSLAGQKSVLLTPFLLCGTYLMARYTGRCFAGLATLALSSLVTVAAVVATISGNLILTSITYRLLAAAAANTSRYFAFFSDHPYYLLTGGLLRSVLPSPYSRPMTMMMGQLVDPSGQLNLNSNMWAIAFGDGGYLAVMLATVLAGIMLWIVDSVMQKSFAAVFVTYGAFLGLILATTALPTAMITGGLLPSIGLLYLLVGTQTDTRVARV